MTITVKTNSALETVRLGASIGDLLKPGDVVCLYGDLGAGKTTFIKGIAQALEIDEDEITSASFVIIAEHYGKHPLYHIDLYRLDDKDAVFDTGIDEYIESDGICVIEWAEKLDYECSFKITIEITRNNQREFRINGPDEVVKKLKPLEGQRG
jgi:tRNA threonylcarbamoyladenosine biosynthesis protein TsaE